MGSQWFLRKVKFQKKQTGHIFMRITQKTPTDSLWEIRCFPRNGSFSNVHPDIKIWGTSYDRPHFEKGKIQHLSASHKLVIWQEELEEMARELRSACQIEDMETTWCLGCLVEHQPNKGLQAMTSLLHVFVGDVWGGHSQDTRWVPTSCKWSSLAV